MKRQYTFFFVQANSVKKLRKKKEKEKNRGTEEPTEVEKIRDASELKSLDKIYRQVLFDAARGKSMGNIVRSNVFLK